MERKIGYPSDVTDEEWQFVLPYPLLCREDSQQRDYELRAVFNAVRWIAKSGSPWAPMQASLRGTRPGARMRNDLPPWHAVCQQMRRWLDAGCFELLVEDVRLRLREWAGRKGQPTAVAIDS